jgi:hypothetical protein
VPGFYSLGLTLDAADDSEFAGFVALFRLVRFFHLTAVMTMPNLANGPGDALFGEELRFFCDPLNCIGDNLLGGEISFKLDAFSIADFWSEVSGVAVWMM